MSDEPALPRDHYDHLKAIAERIFAERGFGHASLQPTALLHEAWLKIEGSTSRYSSRAHYAAVAARAMRQILVDRARTRGALKRGGDRRATTLAGVPGEEAKAVDIVALDQALTELERLDPNAAEIALMRTFGGMTMIEIAEAQGTSERTAARSWRFARAFLAKQLE